MSNSVIKREIIPDSEDNPIEVILPMNKYLMIEKIC
jgi:hypothetical protein